MEVDRVRRHNGLNSLHVIGDRVDVPLLVLRGRAPERWGDVSSAVPTKDVRNDPPEQGAVARV